MTKYLKVGRFANEEIIFIFKDSKTRKVFINAINDNTLFKYYNCWYKMVGYSQLTYNQLQCLDDEYFDIKEV